jgi:tRNA-specific 2-thiouridylase
MQDASCQVLQTAEDELTITFDLPQWAVTPGQSVVIYDGKFCLGGGIIA